MKKVAARLKALNSYSKCFSRHGHTPFSSGEMINVVISMIPNFYCKIMTQPETEPHGMVFEKLVTCLEVLEVMIPEQKKSEDKSGSKQHIVTRITRTRVIEIQQWIHL